MKKLITLLMVALLLTVFNGCQKDDPIISQLTDEEQPQEVVTNPMFVGLNDIAFSVENNRLVFESEEEFQKGIDFLANLGDENFPLFEKEIDFKSYRLEYENNPEKAELFPDELFQTLLNPEMEIIVGQYLFKEDPINQKTYAYEFENCETDLKSTIINKHEFRSSEDIFALLRGEASLKSTYCDGNKLGYYYWNTSGGQVQYKIVYQTGIYKSLQAKIKKDHSGGAEYISISIETDEQNYWKNKNDCDNLNYHEEGGYGREYNIRPYYRTKRLKAYRYKVNYYCSDPIYGVYSNTLKIECHTYDVCDEN